MTMTADNNMTHGFNLEALGRTDSGRKLEHEQPCIQVENLDLYYGDNQALQAINITIPEKRFRIQSLSSLRSRL